MKNLKPLNVVAQIGHVSGGESLICGMRKGMGDVQGV